MGVSPDVAFDLLTEEGGWNDHCEPPWSDDELQTIITNASNYAQNAPGAWGVSAATTFRRYRGQAFWHEQWARDKQQCDDIYRSMVSQRDATRGVLELRHPVAVRWIDPFWRYGAAARAQRELQNVPVARSAAVGGERESILPWYRALLNRISLFWSP